MAKLKAHNPQRAQLKTTGFIGQPEGDIVLTENNQTTNVSSFATATVRVPEPTGTLLITENGEQINIKDKEFVDVEVPPEIPIDEDSLNPTELGVNDNGFYFGDTQGSGNDIAFGRNDTGVYVTRIGNDTEDLSGEEVYIAEKDQLDEQNSSLANYNTRLQAVQGTLQGLSDLASRKQTKIVTPTMTQQIITSDSGYSALAGVIIEPTPLESKTILPNTQQQVITPTAPAIGFSSVTVEATPPPPVLITKQITENGVYKAEADNVDGYDEVEVNVDTNASLNAYIQGDLTIISTNATKIANYLFYYNSFVQNINMPNVVEIGGHAFEYSNINISELPATLTTLNNSAFANTSNVRITAIPDGVTSISQACFLNASGLENIVLPQNLTTINHQGFANCTNLQTVDLSFVNGVISLNRGTGFTNTTCTFIFRDQAQLDAYASATNWAALADRFQIKGEIS